MGKVHVEELHGDVDQRIILVQQQIQKNNIVVMTIVTLLRQLLKNNKIVLHDIITPVKGRGQLFLLRS